VYTDQQEQDSQKYTWQNSKRWDYCIKNTKKNTWICYSHRTQPDVNKQKVHKTMCLHCSWHCCCDEPSRQFKGKYCDEWEIPSGTPSHETHLWHYDVNGVNPYAMNCWYLIGGSFVEITDHQRCHRRYHVVQPSMYSSSASLQSLVRPHPALA